jgi:acyl carrier protein
LNREDKPQMTQNFPSSTEALSVPQALGWIADIFEQPPSTIGEATQRADIPAWDSLGQLLLMAALDQRFGIRMTQTELSSIASVRDILELLSRYGRLRRN